MHDFGPQWQTILNNFNIPEDPIDEKDLHKSEGNFSAIIRDDEIVRKIVLQMNSGQISHAEPYLALRELLIPQLLQHPLLYRVNEWGFIKTHQSQFYPSYVMPLYKTFQEMQKQTRTIKIDTYLCTIISLVHVHHYIRQYGIFHNDIKPANILYDLSDDLITPILIDFGVARQATTSGSNLNDSAMIAGTEPFMLPDIANENAQKALQDFASISKTICYLFTNNNPVQEIDCKENQIESKHFKLFTDYTNAGHSLNDLFPKVYDAIKPWITIRNKTHGVSYNFPVIAGDVNFYNPLMDPASWIPQIDIIGFESYTKKQSWLNCPAFPNVTKLLQRLHEFDFQRENPELATLSVPPIEEQIVNLYFGIGCIENPRKALQILKGLPEMHFNEHPHLKELLAQETTTTADEYYRKGAIYEYHENVQHAIKMYEKAKEMGHLLAAQAELELQPKFG